MRKVIALVLSSIILILFAASQTSWAAASQCPRRCLIKVFADERYNAGMNELTSSFQEVAKTEYFSFVYWDDFEYLLSVEYQIFEDGITVPGWETDAQGRRRIVDKGPCRSHLLLGLWFVAGKP
jgi:hypothetical protein